MRSLVQHAICLTLLLLSFASSATQTAKVDLKTYGANASISMLTMSPNGKYFAYRKHSEKQDALVVVSLADKKVLAAFDVSAIQPQQLYFVNNEQLVFRVSEYRGVMGFRGRFDVSTAFVVNIKDKGIRQLLIPGDKIYPGQTGLGSIVGISPDGKYVYMPAYDDTDGDYVEPKYALFKVSLEKKHVKRIHAGDHHAQDFFMDAQGNLIAQEEYDEKKNLHRILSKVSGKWVEVFREETNVRRRSFVGLTPDFKSLVVLTSDNTNRRNYYTMSLEDGSINGPIMNRADADIEEVLTNIQRVVFGVRYSGFTPSYQFFDDAINKRVNDTIAQFPEQSVWLVDWHGQWKRWVVNVEGSSYIDEYFLFGDDIQPTYLASGRPDIREDQIHPLGKFTYTARDGMKIPSLLTIPRDKVGTMKNLPTIIYPHGGPAAYDRIGFDPWAQALAQEGYLVVQPQFRGSTGFGSDHRMAGKGEWGKKMQDDLTDALQFLVSKGYSDPQRVCIVGASYGGYAALAGGAFTPELYKCVVSINGLGDINDMYSWEKREHGGKSEIVDYWILQYNNGEVDKKTFAAISPINFVEKFNAPVLLIHAKNDQIVPISQSRDMFKKLKKAGKPVEFIELKGDGHGLLENESSQETLSSLIKFVNKHLQ